VFVLPRAALSVSPCSGSSSRGRNRGARYHTAAGSARELIAVIETSVAFGHIKPLDERLMDTLFRIVAVLFKNT